MVMVSGNGNGNGNGSGNGCGNADGKVTVRVELIMRRITLTPTILTEMEDREEQI